ncbi:hypothetical protein JCM14244_03020 [Venenivibrio stagnispumantis]|nr:hypothetical protein [Venenivibrio stagnispumantis]
MDKRQIYFGFLFSVFIIIAILILLFRKSSNLNLENSYIFIISLTSFILPLLLFYRKKISFIKLCLIGYIPAIVGFIISLINQNYFYFFVAFPIFVLSYIVIIPFEEN